MENINIKLNKFSFNGGYSTNAAKDSGTSYSSKSVFLKNNKCDELHLELSKIENEQGIIGKAWDGIKKLFKAGLSSDKTEEMISRYEKGEITYNEALNAINKFKQKQKNATDIIANSVSGILTAGAAVMTGGVGIIGGALIGGFLKSGIKTFERATNNIKGDAIDIKQMAKDSLTGAVDGAATIATAGMFKGAIAGQTVKEAVKSGAIQGAKAGAVTGAAAGAANYTADAIFEEDTDFNLNSLINTVVQNTVSGTIFGGITGCISGGVSQAKFNRTEKTIAQNAANNSETKGMAQAEKEAYERAVEELNKSADELDAIYKSNTDKVKSEYEWAQNLKSVEKVGTRAKSNAKGSILAKLKRKFKIGDLKNTDVNSCSDVIGDGYGVRIQLKSLSSKDAKNIVEEILGKGSYDDFVKTLNYSLKYGKSLPDDYLIVINRLKEEQTGEFFEAFLRKIQNGEINLANDEFNNYGSIINSYLTDEQLVKIANAHYAKTGKLLPIVNKSEINANITKDVGGTIEKISTSSTTLDQIGKAQKRTGYATTQANIQSTITNGKVLADTELQIRGVETNIFGDIEHAIYDIFQGKASFAEYPKIYAVLRGMSENSQNSYFNYITDAYTAFRYKEMGLNVKLPKITRAKYGVFTYGTADELSKAGLEGVIVPCRNISMRELKNLTIEGLSKNAH